MGSGDFMFQKPKKRVSQSWRGRVGQLIYEVDLFKKICQKPQPQAFILIQKFTPRRHLLEVNQHLPQTGCAVLTTGNTTLNAH